ncbi:MAG: four helix bundle protein [Microgenomates group bacterium]
MSYKVFRMKIRSFTHLDAWKIGHELVIEIYKATDHFPKHERYGLIDQLRRAVVSITSNVAEGFYKRTSADKNRFYTISIGSVAELQNQLLIARDLHYFNDVIFRQFAEKTARVHKLLNGLLKSSQTKS